MQYYHDCVAAQLDWSRAINVVEQKDTTILGLTLAEQLALGQDAQLSLDSQAAQQLAKRTAAHGADALIEMGALFLVGFPSRETSSRLSHPTRNSDQFAPNADDETEDPAGRRVCAPLLTTPVSIQFDAGQGAVVVKAQERELSINYGLIGELLGGELAEGMSERLQGLAEIVPDFPIDDDEFHRFWRGFRALATDLPLDRRLPDRRGTRGRSKSESPDESHDDEALTLCDFYLPKIAKENALRLLPAAALVLSRRKGPAQTVLTELETAANSDLTATSLPFVFPPAQIPSAGVADAATTDEEATTYETVDPTGEDKDVRPRAGGAPADESIESLPLPRALTATQADVIRSARTAPLTVVTGPPGTGKSYTITALVLDALQSGQTVLVASQMDKAVSVVVDSVEQLVGELAVAQSGGRAVQRELANKLKRLTGPKSTPVQTAGFEQAQHSIRQTQDTLDRLHNRFDETVADESRWSELWRDSQRLEPICPLPVLELTPQVFRRVQRSAAKAKRNSAGNWFWRWWGSRHLHKCRQWLGLPEAWHVNFDELDELIEVQRLRHDRLQLERRLRSEFPANQLWTEVQNLYQQRNEAALRAVRLARRRHLDDVLSDESRRKQLRQLATLLRRRRHDLKRELREGLDPQVLLWGFPVWAATNRSLGEVLPPVAVLFDLVVIDEASQCDPATAAAALMRGKRAVVVGDPAQLRHVSFLSKAREQAAVARVQLPAPMHQRYHYRRSLFDIAADAVPQDNFFMLREHFRSHPQIIDFSNREFYRGELQIMTARPSRQPQQAVEVLEVAGRRRPDSSVNETEIDVVLQRLRHHMDQTGEHSAPQSLGVLSPFRDHVDRLFEEVMSQFTAEEIARHELVVGTAHSLQGDEKDVVLLSTSIDPQSHPASLRFLQTPNLLNVALTRARERLEIITSVETADLEPGLLRRFMEHASQPWKPAQTSGSISKSAAPCFAELHQRLAEQGYILWPQFTASGESVDLVVAKNQRQIAVLIDEAGSSRGDQPTPPLALHYRLARAGWTVIRLPHRMWVRDWHACVVELERQLADG